MAHALSTSSTRAAAASLAVAAMLVAGCSSEDNSAADDDVVTTTTTAEREETTTTTTEPESSDDDGASSNAAQGTGEFGPLPSWAREFTASGDSLGTIEGEGFSVDVVQLGTATAPKDGMFVDPSTNESILKAGDEVVYVAFVSTNTGAKSIDLSYSVVNVTARYADWQWAQGMDSVSDRDLYSQFGIDSSAIAPGGDAPFTWAPGETFGYGTNFKYQPGSEITFKAVVIPVDADGDLIHDQRAEAELTTTIR